MDLLVSSNHQFFHRDSQIDSVSNNNKVFQNMIDNKEIKAQTSSVVPSKGNPCDIAADESNVGSETDPNLLKAELDFLSTPSTEKYAEDAYQALLSVQDQCEVDVVSLCATPSAYATSTGSDSSFNLIDTPISFYVSSIDSLFSLLGFNTFNSFTFGDSKLDANLEQARRLLNLPATRSFFSRQIDVVREAVMLYHPAVMSKSIHWPSYRVHPIHDGKTQSTEQKLSVGQTIGHLVDSIQKVGQLRGISSDYSGIVPFTLASSQLISPGNLVERQQPGRLYLKTPSTLGPKSNAPGHRQLLGLPKPRHGALMKQSKDNKSSTSGGDAKTFRSQVISGPQPKDTRSNRRLTSVSIPVSPEKQHADHEGHNENAKDTHDGAEYNKDHELEHEHEDGHQKDDHVENQSDRENYTEGSNRMLVHGLTQSQKRANRRATSQALATATHASANHVSSKMLRSQLEAAPLRTQLEGHRKTQEISLSDDVVGQGTDDLWLDDSTDDANDDSINEKLTSIPKANFYEIRNLKREDDKDWGKSGGRSETLAPLDKIQPMPRGAFPPPSQDNWNKPRTEPSPKKQEAVDSTYNYSLGFGSAGDQCLQQSLTKASVGCQAAVSDLHTLRNQYYADFSAASTTDTTESVDSDYHHRPGPHSFCMIAFVILIGIILLRKLYRGRHRKYRHQQINAVLSVVKNNPTLQAAVEAETGAPMPDLIPDYGRRCVHKLVFIVTVVTLVFTSVVVTAHILMAISGRPNAQNFHPPHPVLAFCLWIVVFAVECAAAIALRKTLHCMRQSYNTENASTDYPSRHHAKEQISGQSTRRRQLVLQRLGRAYEGLWGRSSTQLRKYTALVNTDDSVELYHATAPSARANPSVVCERKQQQVYKPPQLDFNQQQSQQQQHKIMYVAAHPVGSINL